MPIVTRDKKNLNLFTVNDIQYFCDDRCYYPLNKIPVNVVAIDRGRNVVVIIDPVNTHKDYTLMTTLNYLDYNKNYTEKTYHNWGRQYPSNFIAHFS